MSEEQLERSILERKASDELRAIATAMSLEPVARLRKADLVNQILRAAGVEVEGAAVSPAKGAASVQTPPSDGSANEKGQADDADGASASKPARARTSRARSAVKTRAADSSPVHAEVNGNGGGQAYEPSDDHRASSSPASALVNGSDPAESRDVVDAVANGAAAVLASPGFSRSGREPAPTTAVGLDSGEPRVGELISSIGAVASATGTLDRVSNEVSSPTRPQRQNQQHSQPGRGNQGNQGGQSGQGGQGGQVETGNRRGRRRRGRDRERGAQEPQGGGQEVAWQGELVPVRGLLDLRDEGYGFLRTSGYLPGDRLGGGVSSRAIGPSSNRAPFDTPHGRESLCGQRPDTKAPDARRSSQGSEAGARLPAMRRRGSAP